MKIQLSMSSAPMHLYGPISASVFQVMPQYAKDKSTAETLYGYYGPNNGKNSDVVKVTITLKKPAKNADVETAARKLKIDTDSQSLAELCSQKKELRKELARAGFDGYADLSILENTEPFQVVPFDIAAVEPAA